MEIKNRSVFHEFFIDARYEAGMVLPGTGKKSLLVGKIAMSIKTLLLTISVFSSCFSFSQKYIFELNYDLKKAVILTAPFHYSKYSYTVIREKSGIHRFIINRDDNTFNHKIEGKKNSGIFNNNTIKIIGTITGKDESFNALFDTKNEMVFFEKADLINDSYRNDESINFSDERFIGITQHDNVFILVGHERKSKSLKFYYKKEGQPIRIKDIDFSFIQPKFGSSDIRIFLDEAAIIDDNTMFDPALLIKEIKLYFTETKIIATCNQQFAFTQLAEIDTASGLAEVKKFNFEEKFSYKDIPDPPISNAFFRNGFLFTGAAYLKSLLINVIDPKTGNILKKYEAGKDDTISFKNTPIYQEGGSNALSATKKIELTPRQFIRKINESELFISVRDGEPEETELMIGSYKEITYSGSPGMFMPVGSLPGAVASAVSFYVTFTPGFSSSWTKTTYMKSLLQKNNFEHISRPLAASIQEKRESYEKELSRDKISKEFRTYEREYLFIYDNLTKKLSVIEFKN